MADDMPSLTLEVLKQIRDEMREMKAELREVKIELGSRLQDVKTELGSRLDRVVHEQIRQSTAVAALEGEMRDHRTLLKALVEGQAVTNSRLDNLFTGPLGAMARDDHARIDDLDARLRVLEAKAG